MTLIKAFFTVIIKIDFFCSVIVNADDHHIIKYKL